MHIIPAHKGMLWKKNTHVFTFSLLLLFGFMVDFLKVGSIPNDLNPLLLPTPFCNGKKKFVATMMKCPWTSELRVCKSFLFELQAQMA